MDLLDQVQATIERHELIRNGDHVLIGVSGGKDSVALAHILLALEQRYPKDARYGIVHINHQLRGEDSEGDARFVRALARELGLPFRSQRVTVRSPEDEAPTSEEASRRERFQAYHRLVRKLDADRLALGQHRDDQVETILARMLRGTGIAGLTGFPPRRPLVRGERFELIRPLCEVDRAAIDNYLRQHCLLHRHDSSNDDTHYLRNRIRHQLLPQLEQRYNPAVRQAVYQLGDIASATQQFLVEELDQRWPQVLAAPPQEHQVCLDLEAFQQQPRIMRAMIVQEAIRQLTGAFVQVAYLEVERVLELARPGGRDDRLALGHQLSVLRHEGQIVFASPTAPAGIELPLNRQLKIPGRTEILDHDLAVTTRLHDRDKADLTAYLVVKDVFGEYIDFDKLAPPLRVRTLRPGDHFVPLGMTGNKKIAQFLADQKVVPEQRRRIPILTMAGGEGESDQPVWVVGYRIDNRVKITRKTKRILEVKVSTLRAAASPASTSPMASTDTPRAD